MSRRLRIRSRVMRPSPAHPDACWAEARLSVAGPITQHSKLDPPEASFNIANRSSRSSNPNQANSGFTLSVVAWMSESYRRDPLP